LSSGIKARLFDADGDDEAIDLDLTAPPKLGDRQLLWVDADLDEPGALEALAAVFELDAPARHRLQGDAGRAQVARGTDRVFLTVEALEPEDPEADPSKAETRATKLVRREIDLVVAPGVVATVHRGPVGAIDRYERSLTDDTSIGVLDPGDLLSTIVDEVINGYFLLIEGAEREVDALDEVALRGDPDHDVLDGIVALRRRANLIRRVLAPHRSAVAGLVGPETRADEALGRPWPGLVERLEGAISAAEALRDALLGTYDIHMGRAAQRANGVMLALTLLSAILLPAVVLAGVMGMNFKLPFFEDAQNFYWVIVAMIAFAALLLGFAKWRRWW
jgi:magnesium transporter